MNKANINLYRQGIRGGNGQISEVGRFIGEIDNRYKIEIDAFSGHGDTYGRTSQSCVTIVCDGITIFVGTISDLIAKFI